MDRDFYVRQLKDWKFSVPIELFCSQRAWRCTPGCAGGPLPELTPAPGTASPWPLTSAARPSSTRPSPTSPKPTLSQNELDYAALQAAVKEGKAEALTGI